ncbi:myophilin [Acrasis kona]|uniref:Myophilin n=1 Tax=Acrasis kona TaxID=1008807 RepID=A0AAW2YSW8_9EUKA
MSDRTLKEKETEVVKWIEKVTGDKASKPNQISSFKDGKTLCKLVNTVKPGTIKNINQMDMPFAHRENLVSFMKGAKTLGLPEHETFDTNDLYEDKNLASVLLCLESFGRVSQKVPGYKGPTIGVKLADQNVRGAPTNTGPALGLLESKMMEMKPQNDISYKHEIIKQPQEWQLRNAPKAVQQNQPNNPSSSIGLFESKLKDLKLENETSISRQIIKTPQKESTTTSSVPQPVQEQPRVIGKLGQPKPPAPSSPTTSSPSTSASKGIDVDALQKLADLRDKGILTEEEFTAKKRQLLGL